MKNYNTTDHPDWPFEPEEPEHDPADDFDDEWGQIKLDRYEKKNNE